MKTTSMRRIGFQILLASSVCLGCLRAGGCLSALGQNFNPCGSILTCDPAEFDLMTMDPTQPNWEYNPTCVIPGLFNCGTPITGLPGAATTTGTTGGGTTNPRAGGLTGT